ncbi:YbgA family protein [Methanolobus sp. WCC5]|uniref:YbgA family protein n=1 Tax=Methanolobus sp. WCC5 TaxID=3125785 RepID=UPI0032458E17
MSGFARPKIVVSKCLGFAACRYDGQMLPATFVEDLKPFVDFIAVCPESEIGLGIPRDPVIIVLNNRKRLLQPASGLDLTARMEGFSKSYLEELDDFDAFILKSKSPSCGVRTTKVFHDAESTECLHGHENGFFADAVLRDYPDLPVIDEQQLSDPLLRDHFLTRVFALASFRQCSLSGKVRTLERLIGYHTRNKLLFMALDKHIMTAMGNIVANRDGLPVEEIYEKYLPYLLRILDKRAEPGSTVNAMMHAFGFFSRNLSAGEKFEFMRRLQEYREDMSVIFELRQWFMSCAQEFNVDHLLDQTFFHPYPPELSGSFRIV